MYPKRKIEELDFSHNFSDAKYFCSLKFYRCRSVVVDQIHCKIYDFYDKKHKSFFSMRVFGGFVSLSKTELVLIQQSDNGQGMKYDKSITKHKVYL